MRIAHFICSLGTGGAETMLVDIVNAQVETESVALVIMNDLVDESLLSRVDRRCVIKLIKRRVGSRSLFPWIRCNLFLFQYRPDIIHFHLEGMRKMIIYPSPKVFTIHNIHTTGKEYPMFDALFAISDGVKNHTKQQGYNAVTVWNGIITSSVEQKTGASFIGNRICRIVCVGRLFTPHKGQDILINALGILKNQGYDSFQLDLIGDGESRAEIESLIKEKGLTGYVNILGQRDRSYIYSHLKDYDLFVLPSRSEGFGLSVVEAMCAKIPVIVSNIEGAMNVIDNGRLGQSFPSEDSRKLSEQISSFMENGTDPNMVENAFHFAVRHFDIRHTAQRYIEEYKKVLNR